jgi:hypothetical protein
MCEIVIGMKSLPIRPTFANVPLALATKHAAVFNDMGRFLATLNKLCARCSCGVQEMIQSFMVTRQQFYRYANAPHT